MTEKPPIKLVTDPDEHQSNEDVPPPVIYLNMISYRSLDPQQVLDKAKEAGLSTVFVLGYRQRPDEKNRNAADEFFASSEPDGGVILWLLERAKYQLMKLADEDWKAGDANPTSEV